MQPYLYGTPYETTRSYETIKISHTFQCDHTTLNIKPTYKAIRFYGTKVIKRC